MRRFPIILISSVVFFASQVAVADVANEVLAEFQQQGVQADAAAGERLWSAVFVDKKTAQQRSCATCHGEHPGLRGKHAKTGKLIEPMAPSVNGERLTERKKINKWFKRNCKWTIGRECTAQEKADFLTFLIGY